MKIQQVLGYIYQVKQDTVILYIFHIQAIIIVAYGYWLASPSASNEFRVVCVLCRGNVGYDSYNFTYSNYNGAARPIVRLPSDILEENES